VERLVERIGRALEREGLLARDAEESFRELDPASGGPMDDLLGHSITYRVAVGPRTGQKVFSLQRVPARADEPRRGVAQAARRCRRLGDGSRGNRDGEWGEWREPHVYDPRRLGKRSEDTPRNLRNRAASIFVSPPRFTPLAAVAA
jgi:hypothetical protein